MIARIPERLLEVGDKVRYFYLEDRWQVHGFGWVTAVTRDFGVLMYQVDRTLLLRPDQVREAGRLW